MRGPLDARTSQFIAYHEAGQEAIVYGRSLSQAFSDLLANAGSQDQVLDGLWSRADDAIADLLQELWKRAPDGLEERAERLAIAAEAAIEGRLNKGELRKALQAFRGEGE